MAAVSSFLETTTTSAFLGTAVPSAQAAAGKARVTMGVSVESLKTKPLALLRVLARQQGVKGITKEEIIRGLSGLPSTVKTYTPPSSYSYSEPSSYGSSSSFSESELQTKPLSELRALAKSLGVRGDTRAEIIKLILAAGPAPSASSSSFYSTPSYTPPAPAAAAGTGLPRSALERKSLMELRAMGRIRGIFGGSKQELIRKLSVPATPSAPAATPSYSAPEPTPAASSYSNGAASYNGASVSGSSASTSKAATVRQLASKSLAQLRAMAAQRGVRGATKDELVRQLAAVL